MRRQLVVFVLALVSGGCGWGFSRDLQMICKTPAKFPIVEGQDPADRAEKISLYWEQNVRSKDTMSFMGSMALIQAGEKKNEIFAMALQENGIDPASCALLDEMKAQAAASAAATASPTTPPAP